jgi:ferredoxin
MWNSTTQVRYVNRIQGLSQIHLVKIHAMMPSFTVRIRDRRTSTDYTVEVPADRYILETAEEQAAKLPFSCRNGACTACAVRVLSGDLDQPEAMGLSPHLQRQGYALLCVSYPRSNLLVETQEEDEVYELQFGRYFGRGKVRRGLPLEED